MSIGVTPETRAWCVKRDHPWVTYNPLMDRTWCRCGERQEAGEQPVDWRAMWEISTGHGDCGDNPCRCYEKHLDDWVQSRSVRTSGGRVTLSAHTTEETP